VRFLHSPFVYILAKKIIEQLEKFLIEKENTVAPALHVYKIMILTLLGPEMIGMWNLKAKEWQN
jgi:hypothetical protein